jgi:carbohydrate-selective porin OprB
MRKRSFSEPEVLVSGRKLSVSLLASIGASAGIGISPVPQFWGGGVNYEGLIPRRSKDVISADMVHAESSKYALPEKTEYLSELNYQWTHSRYLSITPHLQYLLTGRSGETRDATVLGIQLAITL